MSTVLDRAITAKLSQALRASRVKVLCPSEAYVRALNCMAVIRVKTGDVLRPAVKRGNASLAAILEVSRPILPVTHNLERIKSFLS